MKFRGRSFLVLLGLPVFSMSPLSADGEVLLEEDFEGRGGFASQILSKAQVHLAKGMGPDGSDAIKVDYVGDARGSQRVTMRHTLKKSVESATLSFDVMFDEDFQWVLGGKLHGLGPANPITGGAARRPDGWSARIMFKEKGRCAYYIYDQDRSKQWGLEKTARRTAFKAGKWQRVTYEVTLNDPGESNGSARILVDGKEIAEAKKVEFRGKDGSGTLIQNFLFSTFHGGHTPEYAPVDKSKKFTTVHAYFDNIKVTEGVD